MPTIWIQNVGYALRWLRRAPGTAVVAIGSPAIGIGFTVFVFNH